VQKSLPKRQYYVVSPNGRRLIVLGLGGVALSFVAISGREELQLAEDVIDQHGDRWQAEWLRMRGLGDWAAYHDNELNADKRRIA
jgi:type IV secretion system protein TrbE